MVCELYLNKYILKTKKRKRNTSLSADGSQRGHTGQSPGQGSSQLKVHCGSLSKLEVGSYTHPRLKHWILEWLAAETYVGGISSALPYFAASSHTQYEAPMVMGMYTHTDMGDM